MKSKLMKLSSFQFPVSSFQFPVSSFQFPVSSFQFPVSSFQFRIASVLLIALTSLARADIFFPTANMANARIEATATRLPNGKVLVVGAFSNNTLKSAELYDPATNTWGTAGNMNTVRGSSSTSTLLGNGNVLVVGGFDGANILKSAEIYNPTTNAWSNVANMSTVRSGHTATLLGNGRVLVAGGYDGTNNLTSAEIYDPAANTWSTTGNLNNARRAHTATRLVGGNVNGRVLVVGGYNGNSMNSVEIFNPATNMWSNAANMTNARNQFKATILSVNNQAQVLVVGGAGKSAELYDPLTNTWSNLSDMTTERYSGVTATVLLDGKLLVAGGNSVGAVVLKSAEIYDPVTNTWSNAANMIDSRVYHTATLLLNGKVLIAGGYDSNQTDLKSAELYDSTFTPAPIPPAPTVKISGKKQRVTTLASLKIKGSAGGVVTSVTAKLGKKKVRVSGTTSWKLTAKSLLLGKNKLTVTAHGPGGASAPAKITITRNPL